MSFLKNLQFTHLIKINGHLKEFNFRKSNANMDTVVWVDTCDDQHNRISFSMHRSGENWKISKAGCPSWITEKEACISDVIQKELASQQI